MKPVALFLAGFLLASPVTASLTAHAATPEETIAARRANQKRVGELADIVRKSAAAGAAASTQVDAVKEIDERTHLIKGYFPVGTETGGDTKALPTIWSDRAGFEAAADNYVAAFDKLLVIAQSGDTAAFNTQLAAAGATCGACHRNFRAR